MIAPLVTAVVAINMMTAVALPSTGSAAGDGSAVFEQATLPAPVLGLTSGGFHQIEKSNESCLNAVPGIGVRQDSPIRAFQDDYGVRHLIMTRGSGTTFQWTGSGDPTVLRCRPIMTSTDDNTISDFDQRSWVESIFYDASRSVLTAYAHEDFIASRNSTYDCGTKKCWYAAITQWNGAVSSGTNGVQLHRSYAPPFHVALYPTNTYPGSPNTLDSGWIGPGAPSNIVRGFRQDGTWDGYFYMTAYTHAFGRQEGGACLFRTQDPADRTSWTSWTGTGFMPARRDPYTAGGGLTCTVLRENDPSRTPISGLRSILWNDTSRHYVAVYHDQGSGAYYLTSANLVDWSTPRPLLAAVSTDDIYYESLIDFSSPAHDNVNFDQLYNEGKSRLYYRRVVRNADQSTAYTLTGWRQVTVN